MKDQLELRGIFVVKYDERMYSNYPAPKFNGENNTALCGCLKRGETFKEFEQRRNEVLNATKK